MLFVIIGVILLVMNWTGFGPPAQWNFDFFGDLWKFGLPFFCAICWWSWSDASGRTQRKAMQKMEDRKVERREKAMAALGLKVGGRNTRRQADAEVRTGAGNLEQSQDRDLGRREDPRL